jgi:hypothetical protein
VTAPVTPASDMGGDISVLSRQLAPCGPGPILLADPGHTAARIACTGRKFLEKASDQLRHRFTQVPARRVLHRHRIVIVEAHVKHMLTRAYVSSAGLTSAYALRNDAAVTTARELIAELPADTDVIPLPVVRRIINEHLGPWDRDLQSYAVKSGAIQPVAKAPGPVAGAGARKYQGGRGLAVDRDQAVLILVAASLAFAADVPVVGMIRALRASGVDPAVFVQAT